MDAKTLLAVMMWMLPPKVADVVRWPVEARETAAEREQRYADIADVVASIADDPSEAPIVPGPHGRRFSAAAVLAVTFFESKWQRDIDLGLGRAVDVRRNGGQWCMGAINVGRGKTEEGWSGPELSADREKCLRATLHAIRKSIGACRAHPRELWLSVYASGGCDRGHNESRARMRQADLALYRTLWVERQQAAQNP